MSTTATLTPTRLPGLRAAVARTLDRLFDDSASHWTALRAARSGMSASERLGALMRPAPIAGAVALLAACAAGVLIALGAPADLPSAAALLGAVSAG